MANVSEDISQMSLEWLLKALSAFGQLGIDTVRMMGDVGKEGASTLVGLLNYLEKTYGKDYNLKTRMALHKLAEECEKEEASAMKLTIEKADFPEFEKMSLMGRYKRI